MKPELYADEDMDEVVHAIYDRCVDNDCETCSEYDKSTDWECKSWVIFELWRKWRNCKEKLDATSEEV